MPIEKLSGDVAELQDDMSEVKEKLVVHETRFGNGREVMAERVVDKERANFCEYFIPRGSARKSVNKAADAKQALEELFKKK